MFEYLRKRITMKLLLVEDDKELNRTLTYQLEKEGFAVDSCLDGEEACYYMEEGLYDLILLDRMLPKLDGIGVLTEMRKKGDMTPVIMLTALGALTDKITGLDCGADDFVAKSCNAEELLARIRAALRHREDQRPVKDDTFRMDYLEMDFEKRKVYVHGKPVHLTPVEYKILILLVANRGKVLTNSYIQHEIWGNDNTGDYRRLRVFMANVRKKIGDQAGHPRFIRTEIGVGYRFADE